MMTWQRTLRVLLLPLLAARLCGAVSIDASKQDGYREGMQVGPASLSLISCTDTPFLDLVPLY